MWASCLLKGDHTAIEKGLPDRLFVGCGCKKPEELIGENGLLKQLSKALLERALQAGLSIWGTINMV
jgi:hypothetical protein